MSDNSDEEMMVVVTGDNLCCFFCNQNQRKVSTLERDIDVKEQERTRLLTEKGRLEQEAEVGFLLLFCVCV